MVVACIRSVFGEREALLNYVIAIPPECQKADLVIGIAKFLEVNQKVI